MKSKLSFSVMFFSIGLLLILFSPAARAGERTRQERPVPMGVSGGNVNNRQLFRGCCSGTLGAVLTTANGLAILSNNHIFGRYFDGSIGEDISQVGIADIGCRTVPADFIAQVSAVVPVDFGGGENVIDAAIAATSPDLVRDDGFILNIGIPSSSVVEPAIGMGVKKSGRTTGLTFGTIAAIGVTVNVQAAQPCGVVDGIARFVNQIRISPGSFLAGGDSGALMVEDADECPRVVGLVFAGSIAAGIANPITPVLEAFGAQLVGCPAGATRQLPIGEFTRNHPKVAAVLEVQKKYRSLIDIPEVIGTGVGLSKDGQPVLEVYLENNRMDLEEFFPKTLDGIAIALVETGPFEMF
ncbi:MAG: hypothetical protein HYR55_02820 [Acidobacteria bacterium]|nr:hypothetical protein [Acidobacteriota bacterium]MBI3655940.1 hypothetical protein [Acidobacteriota bacterium]